MIRSGFWNRSAFSTTRDPANFWAVGLDLGSDGAILEALDGDAPSTKPQNHKGFRGFVDVDSVDELKSRFNPLKYRPSSVPIPSSLRIERFTRTRQGFRDLWVSPLNGIRPDSESNGLLEAHSGSRTQHIASNRSRTNKKRRHHGMGRSVSTPSSWASGQ